MGFNYKVITRRQYAWIMLILALLPIFLPISLPITIGPYTKDFYNEINNLKKGDYVIYWACYDQGHHQRTWTLFRSIVWQMADKGVKIVFIPFTPTAPGSLRELKTLVNLEAHNGYKYGVDYVMLPYIGNDDAALSSMGKDMTVFQKDLFDAPLEQLPIMDGIKTVANVKLVFEYPQDFTFPEMLMRQWPSINPNLRVIEGRLYSLVTPWYGKYVFGALDGARGGAEYQQLTYPGELLKTIQSRNLVTLWIFASVVLANIVSPKKPINSVRMP